MDIVTSIPVRLNRLESMAAFLESVRGRVTARAYDNYVDGGCLEGHDLDDWLDAERELVIKPAAALSTDGKDLIVEMIQLCQTIDLPLSTASMPNSCATCFGSLRPWRKCKIHNSPKTIQDRRIDASVLNIKGT